MTASIEVADQGEGGWGGAATLLLVDNSKNAACLSVCHSCKRARAQRAHVNLASNATNHQHDAAMAKESSRNKREEETSNAIQHHSYELSVGLIA